MRVTPSDRTFSQMSGLVGTIESLTSTFVPSKGTPAMSDEDIKVALLDTMMALKHQVEINEILIERIQELEKKSLNPFKR